MPSRVHLADASYSHTTSGSVCFGVTCHPTSGKLAALKYDIDAQFIVVLQQVVVSEHGSFRTVNQEVGGSNPPAPVPTTMQEQESLGGFAEALFT
jgi:hypothetical protein